MPLTRIPFGASSVASERTRLSTPARAAEVATMCGSGWRASSEFTQTTAAAFERSSRGRNARVGRMTLKNLSSSSSSQAASVVSAKVETRPWPALLIRTSTPPNRAATASAKRSPSSASRTSQRGASRRSALASAASAEAAASRRDASRPQIATRAPAWSRARAVARPMPDEPPVTTATRFSSPKERLEVIGALRRRPRGGRRSVRLLERLELGLRLLLEDAAQPREPGVVLVEELVHTRVRRHVLQYEPVLLEHCPVQAFQLGAEHELPHVP